MYLFHSVGYTTDDLQFMWQTGDPVQMDAIALPQFDIRQEDIDYGNCTKFYAGTGNFLWHIFKPQDKMLWREKNEPVLATCC